MSLTTLQNPLTALNILPNAMNWRGSWDVSEQYYLNDLVSSPIDSFSYILTIVSLLGGNDPSLSPEWTRLTPISGSGEIIFVGQGDGIIVDETDPSIPVVINDGVVTFTAGTGLTNSGTPTDPIFDNTGVLLITTTTGLNNIGTAQEPELVNTGVLSLSVGTGLSLINPVPNPSVINKRNLKLSSVSPGIYTAPGLKRGTDPPQNPLGYLPLGGFQIPADAVPNSTAMVYNPSWSLQDWNNTSAITPFVCEFFFQNNTAGFTFPQRITCFTAPIGNPYGTPTNIAALPHFPANQSTPDYIQQPQWIVLDNVSPNDTIVVCLKFSSLDADYTTPLINLDLLLYKSNL
jgi:hypothetical protein